MLGAGGNLICDYDTNQTVDSSPAVGNFLAGGAPGIAFGTGSYYAGASDSNTLFGSDSHCNIVWRTNLGGTTTGSPALGDIKGDGNVEVLEGANTGPGGGLVWAVNGANGAAVPGWPQHTSGQIIGGIVTADLTGAGLQRRAGPDHQRAGHLRRAERPGGGHPRRRHHRAAELAHGRHRPQRDHRHHHRRVQRPERRDHPALRGGRLGRTLAGQAVMAHVPPEPAADRMAEPARTGPPEPAHRRDGTDR